MLGGWGRLSQGLSGTLALRPGPHAALRGMAHPGVQQCGLVTTRGRQKPGAPFTDKETGSERPCNSLKPHSRLAGAWPHLQVILGPLGELEYIQDL